MRILQEVDCIMKKCKVRLQLKPQKKTHWFIYLRKNIINNNQEGTSFPSIPSQITIFRGKENQYSPCYRIKKVGKKTILSLLKLPKKRMII